MQDNELAQAPDSSNAPPHEIERSLVSVASAHYSGPLPLPSHLREYENICTGAARDIIDEFKSNSNKARENERISLQATISTDKTGQWMAFVVMVGSIAGAVYLAMNGHEWTAGGLITIPGLANIKALIDRKK